MESQVLNIPAALLAAALTVANWFVWLGWERTPGLETDSPHPAWRVTGMVFATALILAAGASREEGWGGAIAGVAVGVAYTAYQDGKGEASGLFVVGILPLVFLVVLAGLGVAAVAGSVRERNAPEGDAE